MKLLYLIKLFLVLVTLQSVSAIQNCSCVVFRLDDIQDYFTVEQQRAVIQLFKDTNTSLTIGVIGNMFGTDPTITSFVSDAYSSQTPCTRLEIASHGWNHESFPTFNLSDQVQLMQNNQDKMAQMFGAPPKTFIPPYNNINADTLTACRNVGFKFMSSEVGQDPPPYPIDGNFLRWPILPATGVTDTPDSHYVPVPISKVFTDIQTQIRTYGFAAVMMHPYEFALYNDVAHDYLPTVNETAIDGLRSLIQMVKAAGLRTVTLDEVHDYFNASKVHPCSANLPSTTGALTTAPMTTAPLTTAPLTTAPLTTAPLTTAPMTTGEITSAEMTTGEITTGEITSAELTTSPLTTAFDLPINHESDIISSADFVKAFIPLLVVVLNL